MATKRSGSRSNKTQTISSGRSNRGRSSRSSNRGGNQGMIDNLTYDIITVLHQKSKGLEAYDKYLQDARGREDVRDILEEIRDSDQEHVQRLTQTLREILSGGEGMEQEEEAA